MPKKVVETFAEIAKKALFVPVKMLTKCV